MRIVKMTFIKVLLIMLLPMVTLAQDKLNKIKIADGIKVSIPTGLTEMLPEDIALRHPSVRRPLGAYTNDSRLVDFSVNTSASQWRPSDVDMASGFFKSAINHLYDRVDFIQEEVKTINGRKYICFEFESRIDGDQHKLGEQDAIRKYTYIQYLIVKGKTLVFSFNCPMRLKAEWQDTARQMMASVNVNKSI